MQKIRLGVSSCLLGEQVRYDGGHKYDHTISETLGRFFSFVPICPEHECGMSVPREAMRLVGDGASPRLITIASGRDLTEQMVDFCRHKLDEVAQLDLGGFVLKRRSPSCGIRSASLFDENGELRADTCNGLFVAALVSRFPRLPLIDEEQLAEPCKAAVFFDLVCSRNKPLP